MTMRLTRARRAAEGVDHFVANAYVAGRHRAGQATKVLAGTDDHLHGEAEIAARLRLPRRYLLQMLEQQRARIPGHGRGALGDVVAEHGRDRNGDGIAEAEALGQGQELRLDVAEAAPRTSRPGPSC